MKRIMCFIATTAFVLCSLGGVSLGQVDTLTILHVNDTHSHLVPYGPKDQFGVGTRGGIARAASLIGQVRATEKNVMFFHAGDAFVGDLMFNKYFAVPELQILAQLGCDAFTLGNHEFDLTPEVLKLALTGGGSSLPEFDILSANLDLTADPDLAALVNPYVIKDVGTLTVGIFGLTTEETNAFSMPAPVLITSFIDGAVAAVESLRAECQIVIGLTHLGFVVDSILAATVPGIDVIVGGHSHTVLEAPVPVTNPLGSTTWIVQAGAFYDYVGNLKLAYGPAGVEILDYHLMPVDSSVPEVPEITATVDYLIGELEGDPRYGTVYTEMIAETNGDIERDYGPRYKDTPMGNLVTDACREAAGTDIAMAVWGFISEKLYGGFLTGADIFRTIAYGYDMETGLGFGMMTFELSGLELIMGLEYTTEQAKMIHDLYIQVSGMSFVYDSSKPLGEKFIYAVIGEELIDPGATYTITTNSGLYGFLSLAGLEPANPQVLEAMEYEVVRDFIIENSPLHYQVQGRIEDVSEADLFPEGDANCDGFITPGDALCVFWRSILGSFQDECLCEHSDLAGEVNCDGQITPGDALCIFWYSILGEWPEDCLCATAKGTGGRRPVDGINIVSDIDSHDRRLELDIQVHGARQFDAFSLQVAYPDDILEFEAVYPAEQTEKWTALDGAVARSGIVTVGGFHTDGITSEKPVSIASVVFRLKDGNSGSWHFDLTNLSDDLSGAVVMKEDVPLLSVPDAFQLARKYPNPFNPETVIGFSVPVSSNVTVSVYNVLGQIVDILADSVFEPGSYQVTWNAAAFSSGVYYCCLTAGEFRATRKMLLLK